MRTGNQCRRQVIHAHSGNFSITSFSKPADTGKIVELGQLRLIIRVLLTDLCWVQLFDTSSLEAISQEMNFDITGRAAVDRLRSFSFFRRTTSNKFKLIPCANVYQVEQVAWIGALISEQQTGKGFCIHNHHANLSLFTSMQHYPT